jgi:hypothetical protein
MSIKLKPPCPFFAKKFACALRIPVSGERQQQASTKAVRRCAGSGERRRASNVRGVNAMVMVMTLRSSLRKEAQLVTRETERLYHTKCRE